jgi:hypothetical protein
VCGRAASTDEVFYFAQTSDELSRHTGVMTGPRWTEIAICPRCGKRGQAELVETGQFNNRFVNVPGGFRVVTGQYGAELYCETCDIPQAGRNSE